MSDQLPEEQPPTPFTDPIEPYPSADRQLRAVEDSLTSYPSAADVVVTDASPPIGRGWAFSPNKKGFLTAPNGRGVLQTHGVKTLEVWIDKCLHTMRGVHPIYSNDFGMADPFGIIGGPLNESAVGEYEEMIRDAITYHPNISGITDYRAAFTDTGDGVSVAFTVVLDDNTELPFVDVLP